MENKDRAINYIYRVVTITKKDTGKRLRVLIEGLDVEENGGRAFFNCKTRLGNTKRVAVDNIAQMILHDTEDQQRLRSLTHGIELLEEGVEVEKLAGFEIYETYKKQLAELEARGVQILGI